LFDFKDSIKLKKVILNFDDSLFTDETFKIPELKFLGEI
jgi:hypothetical protein